MAIGLFGKLPAKRDFISANVPREFLVRWEEWLQGSLAASKTTLGQAWLSHYLQAPLWRFHLGADVCGLPAVGVFMASIDGVGRHFPLTAVFCGSADSLLPSLDDPAAEGWFHAAEEFLLSCLEPDEAFEAILARAAALPAPESLEAPAADTNIFRQGQACGVTVIAPSDGELAFARLANFTAAQIMRQSSYWWTIGGETFPPTAIAAQGLPDPYMFGRMIAAAQDTERAA